MDSNWNNHYLTQLTCSSLLFWPQFRETQKCRKSRGFPIQALIQTQLCIRDRDMLDWQVGIFDLLGIICASDATIRSISDLAPFCRDESLSFSFHTLLRGLSKPAHLPSVLHKSAQAQVVRSEQGVNVPVGVPFSVSHYYM